MADNVTPVDDLPPISAVLAAYDQLRRKRHKGMGFDNAGRYRQIGQKDQ